jgi:hypothetical protein
MQGKSGAIGYKASSSFVSALQPLAALDFPTPIAAGDALLQFDIVVTQLWFNSTEEVRTHVQQLTVCSLQLAVTKLTFNLLSSSAVCGIAIRHM